MKVKVITRTNTVLGFLDVNLKSRCNTMWIQKLILWTSISWKNCMLTFPGSKRMGGRKSRVMYETAACYSGKTELT
jgi:hypothetical protein